MRVIRLDSSWQVEDVGLGGLKEIFARLDGATPEEDVVLEPESLREVRGKYRGPWSDPNETYFSYYGTSIDGISAATLLSDGRIYVVATVAEWGGTFNSCDDIHVTHFIFSKRSK